MQSQLTLTYNDNRKCLYCNTQIPDQKHASLKFCPRQVMQDRSVKSCKDDFNSRKRKVINEPYRRIVNFHKLMCSRINDLVRKTKGALVTAEHLNQWGIALNRPVQFSLEKGLYHFYFIKFLIKQISETEYQIIEHGKQF